MPANVPPLPIFIHIPKTAGNTLRYALRRLYGREAFFGTLWGPEMPPDPHLMLTADIPHLMPWYKKRIQPGQPWYPEELRLAAARFESLPAERRARIQLIRGHMTYGLHAYLSRPTAYFTLLRHPADHVLSWFYFSTSLRPPLPELYDRVKERVAPNPQTWILAGPHLESDSLSTSEMLARAKQNLRACAAVGLTERFDDSLVLFRKAFGWRWPFYTRRNTNRTRPRREAVPPEIWQRIEADHPLDMALYAEARGLFEARVAAYGPAWGRDRLAFRALNTAWRYGQRIKRRVRRAVRTHPFEEQP